jgi:acid phosphatase family membrane protein YuiD
MTMALELRKFALTVHVIVSVGWAGGVAAFLALAVAGLVSTDIQLVRASYLAMDLTYRTVVIPLGLASLVTGLVSSLATEWGLLRHYWVLVKLALSVPAAILMVVHIQPVGHMAGAAAATMLSSTDLSMLRIQLVLYAGAALLVLLVATALSTYKPRGRTWYGARKLEQRSRSLFAISGREL